uniref:Uncharacterized protein n=1 Tax=viral metagenome TaxID=1070528 RepID=A0A6C0ENI1_9ZZZZ
MAVKNNMQMKIGKMAPLEIVLLVLILAYLFSPAPTPRFIAGIVDHPLGILVLFVAVIFLFLYCHVILGILFVLVAYKLISSASAPDTVAVIDYTAVNVALDDGSIRLPADPVKRGDDDRLQQYGYQTRLHEDRRTIPLAADTNLEVAAVASMVTAQPVAQDYLDTPFKPVLEPGHGAAKA